MRDNYEVVSEGYSRLSLFSTLPRYISLPIAFNQLAQLVLGDCGDTGGGGNTSLPLGRCSIIDNTDSMSILMASLLVGDGGGEGISIFKVL